MATPALVGREDQLRRLSRVIDETVAGLGRLVLISGEPGVGKTRLGVEVLEQAGRRGAWSAVGACWDGAGTPGLWPWVQVLGRLRGLVGDDTSAIEGTTGGDALARLLEGTQRDAPAEFHVFEATLQLLTRACEERTLVVLLDDLQWADPASLSLLDFLHRHAVHLPLLVVGTYRSDEVARPHHPQRQAISDLAQKALTVPLRGLDNDGIRQLRDDLGAPTSTAEAEHLRRLTGGNPFFVIESVAFRDPTESLGVRRALELRIDALDGSEQRVLDVASLIGREVPDALVAIVVGDAQETARAFGVIERSGLMRGDEGQHTFVHDLVRESLRNRLSTVDRRALYASIVEAADEMESPARLLPAHLAWLAVQALPDISRQRVAALLEAAAVDASARLTSEAAGRQFEEAAALADDHGERARLTLESGHAYHRAGSLDLARDRYTSLLGISDVDVRARALLGLHRIGDAAATGEASDVVRGLDAVHEELSDARNTGLRAEVLAARSRSRSHLLADDRSDAGAMAADALDLARSSGDPMTIASCLLAYHDAIWEPGTEAERRAVADELNQTGRALADPTVQAQGLLLRMVAELEVGDPAYRATYQQFDAVAEASRSPRLQYLSMSRRGMVAALRADLATAQTAIDAARETGDRIGEPDAMGLWCDQRWQVASHAGDEKTMQGLLETLRAKGDPHWMVYDALAAADHGDADAATRLAADVAALGERWPRWAARLWDVFNVQLAVVEQREGRIGALVERLQHDAGHWAVLGGAVLVYGPVSLWLGRLEAARGDWHQALTWATDAEVAARRLDADLWLLEARADRLAAEHALGEVDASELASTISVALDRGLVPLSERLEALSPRNTDARSVNVFRCDRDVWTLAFDGVEVRVPDSKGLHDLHALLANRGVDIPATSLATDAFVPVTAPPALDAAAKSAYRRRLDELDGELDRAGARGDAARGERLEREREALLNELRRAAGLGGRDRRINDERERLRKTVTARIRDTLRRLDERHPALAAHLRASVHTGASCGYAPAEPITWDLGR
jgi:hypothetical protein